MEGEELVTCHCCLESITPSEDNPTLICPNCQTKNRPETRIPYDRNGYTELLQLADQMCTYQEVADWNIRAQKEQALIRNAYAGLNVEIQTLNKSVASVSGELEAEKKDYKQHSSLLKRFFVQNKNEKVIAAEISAFERQRSNLYSEQVGLGETAQDLDNLIAYVAKYAPKSPQEKALMLKQIKQEKKELNAKKKEANMQMRAIRSEASNASAHAGKVGLFGFYDSSIAAAQRRGIRIDKEEALAPLEGTKEEIESKILALDKCELFVEKFR